MTAGTAVPVTLIKTEGLSDLMPNADRDQLRVRMFAALEQSGTLSTHRANRATRTLNLLIAACDVEGRAIIQQATLAERMACNVKTVQRALRDLEAAELIDRTRATKRLRHRESNAEGASLYQLLDPARGVVVPDVIPASMMRAAEGASWRLKVASITAESVTKSDTTPEPSDTTPDTTRHDTVSRGLGHSVHPYGCFSYKEQEHSGGAEAVPAAASGTAVQHEQHLLGQTPAAASVDDPAPCRAVTSPPAAPADDEPGDQIDAVKLYALIRDGVPGLTPQALEYAVSILRCRADGMEKASEVMQRAAAADKPAAYFASVIKLEAANPSPCRGTKEQAPKGATPLYHHSAAAVQSYFATLEQNFTEQTEPKMYDGLGRKPCRARWMGRLYVAMNKAGKTHDEVGKAFSELVGLSDDDVAAYVKACENYAEATSAWPDDDERGQEVYLVACEAEDAAADWRETEVALEYAAEQIENGETFPASAITRKLEKIEKAATGTITAKIEGEKDQRRAAYDAQRPVTRLVDSWQSRYDTALEQAKMKATEQLARGWWGLHEHQRTQWMSDHGYDATEHDQWKETEQYQTEAAALKEWRYNDPGDVLKGLPSFPEYEAAHHAHAIRLGDRAWYEIDSHGHGCEALWPLWLMHVYQHHACTIRPHHEDAESDAVVMIGKPRKRPLSLDDAAERAGLALTEARKAREKEQRAAERKEQRNHDRGEY